MAEQKPLIDAQQMLDALAEVMERAYRAEMMLRKIADESPVERPLHSAYPTAEEWQYQYGKWLMSSWAREYLESIQGEAKSNKPDNDVS